MEKENNHIIIFDGVCNFCNGAVNFIIKRDKYKRFMFTPMQSHFSKTLIEKSQREEINLDTIILIKNNIVFVRSEAALEIVKDLRGLWFLIGVFKIIPVSIRDYFYKVFANNRYKIFGRRDVCMIPTREFENRFIQ